MNTQNFYPTHWQISPDNQVIQGIDDLHQCIKNILSTNKGSDILRPNFGSLHLDYIDQPYDIALPNIVREIHIALDTWEKRIVLQNILVTGSAPHFYLELKWYVREDITKQIYSSEILTTEILTNGN